jgi:predicted ATP-dependent serine protease
MAATRAPAFLGRTSEREVLDRLLENVRGGQSAVVVIGGEAGIGKTALLQYCARQSSGTACARQSFRANPGRARRTFYAGARNNVTAAEAGCEHVSRLDLGRGCRPPVFDRTPHERA